MKKKDYERLTFDAPKDLAKSIRGKAAQDGVSMADTIRLIMRLWFAKPPKENA